MTWTYNGDPSSNDRDQVRFWLGDTDSTDEQLSDEEIAFLLDINADEPLSAAIDGAQGLMAKYSRETNRAVGDLQVEAQAKVVHYAALIDRLRIMNNRKRNVGGIFIGNDQKQRLFEVGDMDYHSPNKNLRGS